MFVPKKLKYGGRYRCPCEYNSNPGHLAANHKCGTCGYIGYQHETKDCPLKCKCDGNHLSTEHECDFCDQIGFDHLSKDCPKVCNCSLFLNKHPKNSHIPEDLHCPCGGHHLKQDHYCETCDTYGDDCPDFPNEYLGPGFWHSYEIDLNILKF